MRTFLVFVLVVDFLALSLVEPGWKLKTGCVLLAAVNAVLFL